MGLVEVQGINIAAADNVEIYGEVHWPRHSYGTLEVHVRFIKKILHIVLNHRSEKYRYRILDDVFLMYYYCSYGKISGVIK